MGTMNDAGIETQGDYLAALDALLTRSGRLIRLLDTDLAGQGWDGSARPALLERFLLGDRLRRVRILLANGDFLTRRCPQLLNLLRYRSHQLEIRVAEDGRTFEDGFVLGDDGMVLVRQDRQGWQGRFSAHDPQAVIRLGERFAEDWERVPGGGLGFTTLGL